MTVDVKKCCKTQQQPFESKFVNYVAYFDTSVLLFSLTRTIIGVQSRLQSVTISLCKLGVTKTIKSVTNALKVSVLRSSVTNSGDPWLGYRLDARYAEKIWVETPCC